MSYPNINAERARLGLTQEQMGTVIGVSEKSYRNKENGKIPFNSDELEKLKEKTGRSIDYLLERKENANDGSKDQN